MLGIGTPFRSTIIAISISCLSTTSSAKPETDPILLAHRKQIAVVSSTRADGTLKISALVGKSYSTIVPDIVMYKAALEIERIGYHRFAIIQQKFWSYYVLGQLNDSNAVVVVKPVEETETLQGSQPMTYVDTKVALANFRNIFVEPDPAASQ